MHNNVKFVLRDEDIQVWWGSWYSDLSWGGRLCLSACPGMEKSKNSRPALRLNIGECKAISYSRRPELNTNYSISGVTVENMKDLGVAFDNKLKFDKHINNKINTAYQMLGIEISFI